MCNVCLAYHSKFSKWGGLLYTGVFRNWKLHSLYMACDIKDPSQDINWVTAEGEAPPTLA